MIYRGTTDFAPPRDHEVDLCQDCGTEITGIGEHQRCISCARAIDDARRELIFQEQKLANHRRYKVALISAAIGQFKRDLYWQVVRAAREIERG